MSDQHYINDVINIDGSVNIINAVFDVLDAITVVEKSLVKAVNSRDGAGGRGRTQRQNLEEKYRLANGRKSLPRWD